MPALILPAECRHVWLRVSDTGQRKCLHCGRAAGAEKPQEAKSKLARAVEIARGGPPPGRY